MAAIGLAQLWKPLALIGLLAAALIYRAVLIRQRDAARAQVKTLQARTIDLQASNAEFQQAIARQNAAVTQLQQQMKQAQRSANQRQDLQSQRGAAIMNSHYGAAAKIEKSSVPSDCEGAIKWGNAQAPELGRW
ncbi:MAG: hypothetical protein ACREQE_07360 [Candidatus Binataceae bacterium]